MLTSEQAAGVRRQLIKQIESSFPLEKREEARKEVESMSNEDLESFVKKQPQSSEGECIFCSIVSGNSESYKIAENDFAVAVLEINPVSKGHIIVLPKKHGSFKSSEGLMDFAKQVALIIREKLSPKDVEIASFDFQGHGVINLVPVYTGESMDSERHRASREELEEISKALKSSASEKKETKQKKKRKPRTKKIDSKKNWLPKRIP